MPLSTLTCSHVLFALWVAMASASAQAQLADLAPVRVNSVPELDRALRTARRKGEPVLAYITADWCPSCEALDRNLFSDPVVKHRLNQVKLVVVDVTNDGDVERELLARLRADGPPTLMALDRPSTADASKARLVGVPSKNALLDLLSIAGM